jgi:hypothetical protein
MNAVLAFAGTFLLSLFVALLAALQLADYFGANEEFILVLMALPAFVLIAMLAFIIAYAAIRRRGAIHAVAVILALLALAPLAQPKLVQIIADRSTNPFSVGAENTYLMLELIIPALFAVLVQWGLVRRRWLRAVGDDDFSRWPWVTTVIGGLAVLNPLGLDILAATLRHSPTEWLWQLRAAIAAGAVLVLVVMALIECYIRGRIARRRLATAAPRPESTGNGEISG